MKILVVLSLLFLSSCKESVKSPDSINLPEVKEHSYVIIVRNNLTKESVTYQPANSENFKVTFGDGKGGVACGFKAEVKNDKIFEREFLCAGVRSQQDTGYLSVIVTCDYHSNNTIFTSVIPVMGINHTIDISCNFGK